VARRIAHEIKNPLTPISLAAQRLQRKFGENISDPAFKDCTDMIVDQVDGLKNLVNEFSQFARMPKIKPTLCSLNSTVSEALKLFDQVEKNYSLSFTGDPQLPDFLFDSEQMKRIITNLVDNAVEGLSNRPDGHIEVIIKFDPMLKIVRIEVLDNGAGIPKYMRNRIFEPYVTSKKHGTGLGLAIVKRAVEDHNGFIRALDKEPSGTRFVIELPVIVSNTANTILRSNLDKHEGDSV
jgi:two-component system nitrogen regulation sensor histidine kinase NtrY